MDSTRIDEMSKQLQFTDAGDAFFYRKSGLLIYTGHDALLAIDGWFWVYAIALGHIPQVPFGGNK